MYPVPLKTELKKTLFFLFTILKTKSQNSHTNLTILTFLGISEVFQNSLRKKVSGPNP